MCDEILIRITEKKHQLDALKRTALADALGGLDQAHFVDVNYTSNALDGNTLTASETASVLEEGLAVSGKSLEHHMLALDHARAFQTAAEIGKADNDRTEFRPISRTDLELFHLLLHRRTKWMEEAYLVRDGLNNPVASHQPPQSFIEFVKWLRTQPDTPGVAIAAHNRLIESKPFAFGNERMARLLMNFILMRAGFPPIAIRPEDRPSNYASSALEQPGKEATAFSDLIYQRLDSTLDLYLEAAHQGQASNKTTN